MVNGVGTESTSLQSLSGGATAVQQVSTATGSTTQQQTGAQASDSVKLSATAQAHAMYQQGMTVKTIAANMGISSQAVDSYLGISSLPSGAGGGGTAELQAIASRVRVNGPQGSTSS